MYRIFKFFGVLFIFIGIFFFKAAIYTSNLVEDEDSSIALFLWILAFIFNFSGISLWRKGKRQKAKKININLQNEIFVLYLRPFSKDKKLKKTSQALIFPTFPGFLNTKEENLAKITKPFGVLITLSNPKQSFDFLGAKRLTIEDQKWKETVLSAIEKSNLVIFMAGISQSTMWELEQIIKYARKKAIILLPGNKNEYDIVSDFITSISEIILPKFSNKSWANSDVNLILYFDQHNNAYTYYPKVFYFQLTFLDSVAIALKNCLQERTRIQRKAKT